MTRRQLRHALALPVLAATLLCVALPAPALAQPGKGHGKGQQDDSGYERSRDKRDDGNDQRDYGGNQGWNIGENHDKDNGGNRGKNSDRGYADQKHQSREDSYDRNSDYREQSGRGRAEGKHQRSEDSYNNGKHAQQYQSLSPQQAAQRARSQYGGQVLKVQPSGGGFQVRLLQEDGRVVTVPIAD